MGYLFLFISHIWGKEKFKYSMRYECYFEKYDTCIKCKMNIPLNQDRSCCEYNVIDDFIYHVYKVYLPRITAF